jgi:hypothetical protein
VQAVQLLHYRKHLEQRGEILAAKYCAPYNNKTAATTTATTTGATSAGTGVINGIGSANRVSAHIQSDSSVFHLLPHNITNSLFSPSSLARVLNSMDTRGINSNNSSSSSSSSVLYSNNIGSGNNNTPTRVLLDHHVFTVINDKGAKLTAFYSTPMHTPDTHARRIIPTTAPSRQSVASVNRWEEKLFTKVRGSFTDGSVIEYNCEQEVRLISK